MKNKHNRKRITMFLCIVLALTLAIGSFAYFTDRVDGKATATTVKASDIIDVTPEDPTDPGFDPENNDPVEDLINQWEANNTETINDPVRPGDAADLSYTLSNIGDGPIDVRETIILTTTEAMNLGADGTANTADDAPEFRLFSTATKDAYNAWTGVDVVVTEEVLSATQIKYTIEAVTLAKGASVDRDYILVFDKYASNAFQGDTCYVDYLVEMRQHIEGVDADDDWASILLAETTFGKGFTDYDTVLAAN